MFGIGLGRMGVIARAARTLFSPSSLFANNEQGAWYDPSDLTTLFQDSAGTTPVTAVEQPVGLMLDKSKGLVLGSELVTNGDFSSGTTGWTASGSPAPTLGAVAGRMRMEAQNSGAPTSAYQAITTVVGRWYRVTGQSFYVSGTAEMAFDVRDSTSATDGARLAVQSFATGVSGAYSLSFLATGTTTYIHARFSGAPITVGATYDIDNISVRELPGNHAFQTTSASRPVLSARVNLLTKTEQFDDAVWTKLGLNAFGSGSVANTTATTDPLGGNTADFLQESTAAGSRQVQATSTTAPSNARITCSIKVKAAGRTQFSITIPSADFSGNISAAFNLSSGTASAGTNAGTASGASSAIAADGNGWYTCTLSGTPSNTASTARAHFAFGTDSTGSNSYTGDGTSGIFIFGADLRVSNDGVGLPAYQRVNTATDYDTTGFPMYLRCDGVDDGMVTNSIDFTATDKMTVWAGVRKLSDAGTGVVVEISVSTAFNNGAFALISDTSRFAFYSKGTSVQLAQSAAISAPVSNTLTGIGDISGDLATLRINGTQVASNTGDQGTGNYGNYPLFLFRRGGATLPANLRFHCLILRGAASTTAQIEATEAWVNSKTKAYA